MQNISIGLVPDTAPELARWGPRGADPVTDTAKRGPGRPRIPLERIVDTALQIVDEQGADALSLRALADRLSSGTATLYRHVSGRAELMSAAYRRLIKEGQLLDPIAEEVAGLIEATDNEQVRRQLFRVLGDTYSRQGRYREAMAAYSTTLTK